MVPLCRIGGKIVVVGVHEGEAQIDLRGLCFKEITLIGSRVYRYPDFEKGIDLIQSNKNRFSSLITNRINLESIVKEMKELDKGEGLKSLVNLQA